MKKSYCRAYVEKRAPACFCGACCHRAAERAAERPDLCFIKWRESAIIYITMGKKIDEKTLAAAKEKLACKIEPAAFASAAAAGSSLYAADPEISGPQTEQEDHIGADGKVLLTRMTSAGG